MHLSVNDTKINAAIYCRISRDQTGEASGVDRQQADCRALADRLGWEVVAVYIDNDISAYSGKPRPQYRAMLEAVKAGQVRAVLAWHPDRLYRRAVDLEEIVNIAEAHNLQIATVTAGDVDLSTPAGRMTARIIAAVAQHEVEHTKNRVKSKKAEAAKQGKYRGGRRPFGYNKDGVTIRKKEAEHLRHAVRALLAGRSLAGVVRELNEMGSRSSTGHEWDPQSLRPVLLRARNAGLIHSGPVWHRDLPPDLPKAVWEPIISEEEWRAVHKLLTSPKRLTPGAGASEPRWLGSGIYTCGLTNEAGEVCGSVMRVTSVGRTPSRPNSKRRHHYRCAESAHLTISVEQTDAHVLDFVADMVRDPRFVEGMTAGEGDAMQADRERRALLVTRIQQTDDDYDNDLIDARTRRRKMDKLTAELNDVEARLAEGVQQAAVLPIFSDVDPGAAFLAAPIDVQRAVLRAVLRVEVGPAEEPRRVWRSERLNLTPVVG